jgi:16S rRNA (guanine527-N7)-methyltransferase
VPLDATARARLLAYLDAVLDVNRTLNLTSVRTRDDAVVRHLLDSLSAAAAWHALAGPVSPARVLDLGTGGGFPGAVLAVVWPAAHVLMIDATGKKVRAVAGCLASAGIRNAETLHARGTDLVRQRPQARGSFDLCVARAVGVAAELVRELAPLVAPGGLALLMKGAPSIEEVESGAREAVRRGLVVLPPHAVDVPGLDRRAVLAYGRAR